MLSWFKKKLRRDESKIYTTETGWHDVVDLLTGDEPLRRTRVRVKEEIRVDPSTVISIAKKVREIDEEVEALKRRMRQVERQSQVA